jgi:hypothetical protein
MQAGVCCAKTVLRELMNAVGSEDLSLRQIYLKVLGSRNPCGFCTQVNTVELGYNVIKGT